MKRGMLLLTLALLSACGGKKENSIQAPAGSKLSGYTLVEADGAGLSRAQKRDAGGNLQEEGFVKDGSKEGSWTIFQPGLGFPQSVASYVGGKLNGPYIEFNEENKITLLANYENNLLHGKWFRYQYGELAFSAEYRKGKLHGLYKEYRGQGKVAKEISYTDGELDGPYRFFDDSGKVVLEYTYRKGKKIGD